ncbi:hypothetical protein HOD05_04445 [Candidatus Woesearchaeota archaeon]|jgi:hypothetical protein|nr:hypothetical protein [Candidatus Woesearchaeota archaeon]MBT4247723.1 hypothetical protein [Candidatus Woesearchaeota archaeon]MBT4434443.1 hypothetical protein [Candidatus Woesearchaeota archaeon]MBT7332638.1 hypothetical protein [Candidatus Woesearchaeota archaeon]
MVRKERVELSTMLKGVKGKKDASEGDLGYFQRSVSKKPFEGPSAWIASYMEIYQPNTDCYDNGCNECHRTCPT